MNNLIKALQIFIKYENNEHPTNCEHDTLYVCIHPDKVSDKDKAELDKLGFFVSECGDGFESFVFGSC